MFDKVFTLSVGILFIIGCENSPDDSFYLIDISKPREGENFTLPAQIFVQATNIPVERNSDPEWHMVENSLAWDFTPLPSLEETFSEGILSKFTLYNSNNDFGDHTVIVSFEDKDGNNVANGVTVQIFYPRDDNTNPGSGDPNWYYYWSQALGVVGEHIYDPSISGSGETIVYSASSWVIRIGPDASWPNGNPPTGHRYINGFWATNLHEFWHRDHRVHNFSVHGGWNPPPSYDYDGDGICDHEPGEVSPTNDNITKGWEAMIGTDWDVWNDVEIGANWAESNGTYGYDGQDWAYPGSQWE
jgi:hypothetical protein